MAHNLFGYTKPQEVAIKIRRNTGVTSESEYLFLDEIELMGKIGKHLNIVNLLGVVAEGIYSLVAGIRFH